MDGEALQHYLADGSRRGPAGERARSGTAGGAPCGDLVRLSLELAEGRIQRVTHEAEGCAASRAAAAATAELVEGESVLDAALIGASQIEAELGGLNSSHRHAAELAADALGRALSALAGSASRSPRRRAGSACSSPSAAASTRP